MHSDVLDWVRYALERTNAPAGGRILEIGSRDWNGTPRRLFPLAQLYVGVDKEGGSAVDLMADGAMVDRFLPRDFFDIVLCLEVLEHAPEKGEILDAVRGVLRPGGVVIITAAAPGRPEHDGGTNFYGNIDPVWLSGYLGCYLEKEIAEGLNEAGTPDIRAWARK